MSKLSLKALETTVGSAGRMVISKANQEGCELSTITLSDLQSQISTHPSLHASTTTSGHTRYATPEEAISGVVADAAITPVTLAAKLNSATNELNQNDGWFPVSFGNILGGMITVAPTPENSKIFIPRRALRYRIDSSSEWHYGMVKENLDGSRITIFGATPVAGYTEVQYGALWRTQQATLTVPGNFAVGGSSTILLDLAGTYEPYELPVGRLVMMKTRVKTAYATAPTINIMKNGSQALFSTGVPATTTFTSSGAIVETYNQLVPGDALTLFTTSGTGTGSDLTVTYCVVLE